MAYARYEDFQKLEAAKAQVEAALENLKKTQQQLVTQEKLASLGQLTAGIAHEIKNPLNFVNNFAALSVDLAKELREEIEKRRAKSEGRGETGERRGAKGDGRDDFENIEEILATLEQNTEKINHHGKRADSIVKSMMQHARGTSGQRELTDINQLLDEAVNLTYHGMRANDASFNVTIEKEYDSTIGKLEVVPQDLSRVFLNMINNACYAAHMKAKGEEREAKGEKSGAPFALLSSPFTATLSVSTKNLDAQIEIRIRDNGNGIPAVVREKIFTPFFTTKPTGQGTGLGLSISHDIIVQQHRGEIKVETEEGKFTEFVVRLPRA
jgi:signal transduction histidine kinase